MVDVVADFPQALGTQYTKKWRRRKKKTYSASFFCHILKSNLKNIIQISKPSVIFHECAISQIADFCQFWCEGGESIIFLKAELPVVEPYISPVSKVLVFLVGESLEYAFRAMHCVH